MSQTAAIQQHLSKLSQQLEQCKKERSELVVALAARPGDRTVAKKFADVHASIPKIEDEISAYELALQHAEKRDREDQREAKRIRRRAIADQALQECVAVDALNVRIWEAQGVVVGLEKARDAAREKCRHTAMKVISPRDSGGRQHVYEDRLRWIVTYANQDHAGNLKQKCLDHILYTLEQEEAAAAEDEAASSGSENV